MLYLPHGVACAGYLGAAAIYALTYGLFILGVSRLLRCWELHAARAAAALARRYSGNRRGSHSRRCSSGHRCSSRSSRSSISSSLTGLAVSGAAAGSFSDSYSALAGALLGPTGRACVQTCVVGLQLGCGASYFIFVAETVQVASTCSARDFGFLQQQE
jgi:amino acid permease